MQQARYCYLRDSAGIHYDYDYDTFKNSNYDTVCTKIEKNLGYAIFVQTAAFHRWLKQKVLILVLDL